MADRRKHADVHVARDRCGHAADKDSGYARTHDDSTMISHVSDSGCGWHKC